MDEEIKVRPLWHRLNRLTNDEFTVTFKLSLEKQRSSGKARIYFLSKSKAKEGPSGGGGWGLAILV